MHVALVASLVSPIRAAEANGPHAVILDLARGLQARRHEVTVYAAAGSSAEGVPIVQVPVEPEAQRASLRVDGAASESATAALDRAFGRLFSRLRRDRPDVISQHAFDAAAFELAEEWPALHTLHMPPIVDGVVAAARATGSQLAAVSEASRLAWQRAGVHHLIVLRNGVPDRGEAPAAPLPAALVAGRISPEKGTHVAIRVARRAGLDVIVAGDAYDPAYFENTVRPLLRPGEWVGPLPRAELSRLTARCYVLLMPIRWEEPFGLVAAEAQMAGCPVVGYRRGALPEVVPSGIGGWLIEPDDEDALAAAVALARCLDRSAIRARAQRELGVEPMVEAYEKALLGAVSGAAVLSAVGAVSGASAPRVARAGGHRSQSA